MKPKARTVKRPRAGKLNEQVVAERIVEGMMAKDAFSQWLGITVVDVRPRTATVRATVRAEMVNGLGVAHGGIAYAIADSAFAFACNTHGKVTVAIDNAITYPSAVQVGDVLTAVAESEHESHRLGFYRVIVRNQRDETVAIFKGTAYKTRDEHAAVKPAAAADKTEKPAK